MNTLLSKSEKFPLRHTSIGLLTASGIFLADTLIPLGVADGILYISLVLIGQWARSRNLILGGALLGSVLTVVGFFLSPTGGELWKVISNRLLGIAAIWMTALPCLWHNRSQEKFLQAFDHMEDRVNERTAQLKESNERLGRETEYVQLHKDIAVASNETRAVNDTLEYCLKRICHFAGWPVGHLYLSEDRSSKRLIPTAIWYLENPERFKTFRKITEMTPLDPGVGLPGRVLAGGKPAWIIDVLRDPNFPRAKAAGDIGVKAGFAFPVLIGKEVAGVMEFFSAQAVEPDSEMLEIMAQIGTQLGRVIERKWAEEDQDKLLHSLRERVKELTCMYGVANLIDTSKTMKEVFEKIESHIILGWQFPEITRVRVNFEGETFVAPSFQETPWKISSDINVNGKKQGSLEVFYTKEQPTLDEGPFLKEERLLIDGLARLLSVAVERKRAEEEIKQSSEQLRNLYHRLELVREEERTRIAREVHDELAQVLTTLKLELSLLDKKLVKDFPGLRANTQMMLELIDTTIQFGKKIVMDLRPPLLDDLGLLEAIRWQGEEFERRTGIRCELKMNGEKIELDQFRSTTVFRIFQETLTNVTRHAQAKKIHIRLEDQEEFFTLRVQDDGIGITPDQISNKTSLGILGMRERANGWQGRVDFQGAPDEGTTVTIKIRKK